MNVNTAAHTVSSFAVDAIRFMMFSGHPSFYEDIWYAFQSFECEESLWQKGLDSLWNYEPKLYEAS